MTKSKLTRISVLALAFAIFIPGGAQSPPLKKPAAASVPTPQPMLLPSSAQVDAALKRTFGYDPSFTWQIIDIHPSLAPDIVEVLVSINKQAPNRLWITPDGHNAIVVGDVIPWGPDPFAAARQKLQAANGPDRGAQNPAILVVDFSDLECPHCKAAQPVLEKLVADFPQIRLVFQQFPLPASLHPWAMKAAQYADCAGRMDQKAFWKFVDSVFENQGAIAAPIADDKLKELAATAGLNAQKTADCATALDTEARVKKSMELGQSLEVNETPTVFINGRRVKAIAGIPYELLKAMVQFEIDHAGK